MKKEKEKKISILVKDSADLKDKPLNAMKGSFVEVSFVRSRSIKGAIDIKKELFKDIIDPHTFKSEKEFTQKDWNDFERYQAKNSVVAKFASFMDPETLFGIKQIEGKMSRIHRSYCLSPELSYMRKEDVKDFTSEIMNEVKILNLTIKNICNEWDSMLERFSADVRVIVKGITDEEVEKMLTYIPSKEIFAASYRGKGEFIVTGINSTMKQYNFETGEYKTANDIVEDDLKSIIASVFSEVFESVDRIFGFVSSEKKYLKKSSLERTANIFKKRTEFLGNDELNRLLEKIEAVSPLSNINDLKADAENIAIHVYRLMIKYEIKDIVKMPKTISEEVMEQMIVLSNQLQEVNLSA